MSVLKEMWRYWKWLCVALVTTCVVLGVLALLLGGFDKPEPDQHIGACIESGGTWVDEEGICKTPA